MSSHRHVSSHSAPRAQRWPAQMQVKISTAINTFLTGSFLNEPEQLGRRSLLDNSPMRSITTWPEYHVNFPWERQRCNGSVLSPMNRLKRRVHSIVHERTMRIIRGRCPVLTSHQRKLRRVALWRKVMHRHGVSDKYSLDVVAHSQIVG